jgi:hypothetical protein
MKRLIIITSLLILATACNKNQSAVQKLNGSWSATNYEVTENGTTSDYLEIGLDFDFHFDNCKLQKNDYCQITTTVSNNLTSNSEIKLYRVINDGMTLEIKDPIITENIITYRIDKVSSQKVKLEKIESNSITQITLKKTF